MLAKILAPLIPLVVNAIGDYLKENPEILDSAVEKLGEQLTDKLPDLSALPGEVVGEVGQFVSTVAERLVPDVNTLANQIAAKIPGLDGIAALLARFGIR